MGIKITIPNTSSDTLTFGSANTPTAAQIAGIDSGSSNGQLALYTTASGTSTEAMRINASQNVGIGTTSPAFIYTDDTTLTVNGKQSATSYRSALELGSNGSLGAFYFCSTANAVLGSYANIPLAFRTNNTERMRIDSSGNLLVGGTTVYASLANSLQLQNGNNIQIIYRNTGTTAGRYFRSGMDSGSSWTIYNDASTGVYLAYGGTSWTANSDERLKTTLTPFANAIEKICTLRAGTGRYLTDEETVSRSFLIAQDVQKVLPEAVHVQEDELGTLGLRYQDLIPLLVTAIQEQQVLITQLQADVAALKGTA
jgi:hypothetical protein